MEEALDALQAEREAKYAIKKDLDARINSESMFNLSNLAYSIKGKVFNTWDSMYLIIKYFFFAKDSLKNMELVKAKTMVLFCRNWKLLSLKPVAFQMKEPKVVKVTTKAVEICSVKFTWTKSRN